MTCLNIPSLYHLHTKSMLEQNDEGLDLELVWRKYLYYLLGCYVNKPTGSDTYLNYSYGACLLLNRRMLRVKSSVIGVTFTF